MNCVHFYATLNTLYMYVSIYSMWLQYATFVTNTKNWKELKGVHLFLAGDLVKVRDTLRSQPVIKGYEWMEEPWHHCNKTFPSH